MASSRAWNRTPSMTASVAVTLPEAGDLISVALARRPSMAKTASLTNEGLTTLLCAGVRPDSDHSEAP